MNIDTLTDKIYKEGIEKAEIEAVEIIQKATSEAEKIILEAKESASIIIKNGEKKSAGLYQNTLTDIRLAGNKSVLSLKQEIKKLIKLKVVQSSLHQLFSDPAFLKEIITKIIQGHDVQAESIILPENIKNELQKSFISSIRKTLPGLTISFSEKIKGGFQIVEKESGYIITFTDEDFTAFFTPFLNEVSEKTLFHPQK